MISTAGLVKQLSKALIERAMQADLTEQIGYGKNQKGEKDAGKTKPLTRQKKRRTMNFKLS